MKENYSKFKMIVYFILIIFLPKVSWSQQSQLSATISGTATTCLNETAPILTFTGFNGTTPENYKFYYTINGGPELSITSASGVSTATISVSTATSKTDAYSLIKVEDLNTSISQNQSGTATIVVGACTQIRPFQCGNTLATMTTVIEASPLAGATQYRFEVTDTSDNSTRTVTSSTYYFNSTQLTGGLIYNRAYSIRVQAYVNQWLAYGTPCIVTTPNMPLPSIVSPQCGSTLASLNSTISSAVINFVDGYRFRVTSGGDSRTIDVSTTARAFNLTQLANWATFNTTYSIDAAVLYQGVWSSYGTACTLSTPKTKVIQSLCGSTLASINTTLYADAISGATKYRFKVSNGTTDRVYESSNRYFTLNQLSGGGAYNTIYDVKVAIEYNGIWQPYGDSCNVTTPIMAPQTIFSENMGTLTAPSTSIAANTFQNSNTLNFSSNSSLIDIRTSSVSSGYTDVSGGGNLFFSSNAPVNSFFSIAGINASNFTSLSLQFGYRKESASVLPVFSVEYWNGNSWVTITEPLLSQLSTDSAVWYLSNTISLPIAAQINNLGLRFVKTGSTSIRIDDVKLYGIETRPTLTNSTVSNITSNSVTFSGNVTATGGSPITANGTVYAATSTNAVPTLSGSGVTVLTTSNPNAGTGIFTNNSGTVLSPNVQYSYKAFATKSTGLTGYGTVATFYTLAATPTAPTISNIKASTLNIAIGSDTNSSLTTYSIYETTTSKYVQADGTLGNNPTYQTALAWGIKTVTGLTPSTLYTFQVTARNASNIVTSAGEPKSGMTLAMPSIIPSGTLSALNTVYGTASNALSFSVSGANLTGNIVVTPPAGFEISQTTGTTGYASSLIVTPSSGSVPPTTLYIRLAATTAFGTYSGDITFSSNEDGLTVSLATVLSSVSKLDATITGVTASNKVYDGSAVVTLNGTAVLNGVLPIDTNTVLLNTTNATAAFTDATIGIGKAVTVSGYTLSGSAAVNYNLIQPLGLTATITANASSDVVLNRNSSTSKNEDINYIMYQGNNAGDLTNTSSSIGVMGFHLRDGGIGLNDADNLGTVLTAITFNVEGASNIRYARLFDTNAPIGVQKEVFTVNGISTITFSGLNIIADDDSQFPINLRVTFKNTVTDNEQMKFTIASVTAGTLGSQFATFNGGGASSREDNNINRIEVTSDRLAFVQQPPTSTFVQTNMNPAPQVAARDINNNLDEDFEDDISIASSGTLSSPQTQTATATAGVATFNAINHIEAGTGLVLTGTSAGLDPAISNTFTITPLIVPTFDAIDPICSGTTLTALPLTSTNLPNGITGTWSPALNNTATTVYTFTPNSGQNAASTTLTITVNPIITPTFTSIAPVISGSTLNPLPTTSINGITGTWSPALNNTATTTYTFTPNQGQCATTAQLIIEVTPVNGNDIPVSPSQDQNYIITRNYKIPTQTSISSPSPDKAQVSITYFDGLGRPMQQIANQQSSNGKDIITHIEYDDFGRQDKEYLPYASTQNNMAYVDGSTLSTNTIQQYQSTYGDNNPFSQKEFEASPLNRVLKQAAPGNSWALGSGHEIKFDYQTNQPSDAVKNYTATADWNIGSELYEIGLVDNGIYEPNELYKTITKDENTSSNSQESDGSTVEFKNKEGQVILKRTYDNSDPHDTYYVYDVYGNLTYVIPPLANNATDTDQKNNLCYQYKYDHRNRLVEKKLPGKQWEFIVYDKLDRPVATGPALSPFGDSTEGWLITKYDVFGRVIYTGWMNNTPATTVGRKTLQGTHNNATVLFEEKVSSGSIDTIPANYNNTNAPTDFKLLTVNYYDNYNFPNAAPIPTEVQGQTVSTNVKGLATGSWTRVLTSESEILGETTTTFYDTKARPIRSYLKNYLGGFTSTDSSLELISGQLKYTITEHQRSTIPTEKITVRENFTYSPQGRLLTHTHQINNNPQDIQLLASNTYDALGQLISKEVGNTLAQPLQKVDYSYNIRGWLTGINKANSNNGLTISENDLFGYKINYNTVEDVPNHYTGKALFNGNISETYWRKVGDVSYKKYGYHYDDLNRLVNATYQRPEQDIFNSYNESLGYDKNGNIKSLQRNGESETQQEQHTIDDLTYVYSSHYSNQLMKVTDATNDAVGFKDDSDGTNDSENDYSYDANGNLITDTNKEIANGNAQAIIYNHLNLPTKIVFGTKGSITYIYNANGAKVKKTFERGIGQAHTTDITDYLQGYQYNTHIADYGTPPARLQFFPTAEGYVNNMAEGTNNTARVYGYVFNFTDHLGNIRLSYQDIDKNGSISSVDEILDENNYYPFGLRHEINGAGTYKYKYQGQERQDELGLNWDSFKWRNYDYAIGRFMSIDPLAQDYAYNSPYAFQENKMGMGRELEGLELVPLVRVALSTSDAVKLSTEVSAKVSESATRAAEPASKIGENAARGRATESEQLGKNGYEKNTQPYRATDSKTGQEGTTIPDAMKPDGGTVEIKNVQKQSLTEQLRLQKEISTGNGAKPELIINQGAKLSKPLQNAGFDIKTYQQATPVKDNTNIPLPQLPKSLTPSPKQGTNSSVILWI